MDTLSNNRGNAAQLGLWCVNANNGPSNANANNWGSRQSPQLRRPSRVCSMNLNQPPIKDASGLVRKECVGQFPLIGRSLVAPPNGDSGTDALRKGRCAA